MSDFTKTALRWVSGAIVALISWLGLKHPEVFERVMTSVAGILG